MPSRSRGGNIGRHTRRARTERDQRANSTHDQHLQRNIELSNRVRVIRAAQTPEERSQHLETRRVIDRQRNTDNNRLANRERMRITRAASITSFNRLAFAYEPDINYSAHEKIAIGEMSNECNHCHALKFKYESPGMCCCSGKVVLPPLNSPPEPLKTLLLGESADSKIFLKKTRKFNSCFQMTSFGAKIITNTDAQGRNFDSTFKIQGQVHHKIGGLYPLPNDHPKFLQIYFLGDEEEQVSLRCNYNHIERIQERSIVASLETFLAEKNSLIRLFKHASERMITDNYMIVIKPDKLPLGEHTRRFNAPTVNEVAVVMVGDTFEQRDITVMRRSNTIQVIHDSHRSYDALQYPLIFWEGDDGYHINIKQTNPQTG